MYKSFLKVVLSVLLISFTGCRPDYNPPDLAENQSKNIKENTKKNNNITNNNFNKNNKSKNINSNKIVTEVYVDSKVESDGYGSLEHPFNELRKALNSLGKTETIHLASGEYTMPLRWTIKNKVKILGKGTEDTFLISENNEVVKWQNHGVLTIDNISINCPLELSGGVQNFRNLKLENADILLEKSIETNIEKSNFTNIKRVKLSKIQKANLKDLNFIHGMSFIISESTELIAENINVENLFGPSVGISFSNSKISNLKIIGTKSREDLEESDINRQEMNWGDGLFIFGGTINLTNSEVKQSADRGIYIERAVAEMKSILVEHSDKRSCLVSSDFADVTVKDSTFHHGNSILFTYNGKLALDNVIVSDARTYGLLAASHSDIIIENSFFHDCNEGHVAVMGEGSKAFINNNEFKNAVNTYCGSFAYMTEPSSFTNNIIEGCAGAGISITEAVDITVEGNTISNIVFDKMFGVMAEGVSVMNATATVSNNTIFNTKGYGIGVLEAAVNISKNIIGPVEDTGISVVDCTQLITTIEENKITKAVAAGIVVLNSVTSIIGNTVEETVYHLARGMAEGILFGMGSTVTVKDNITQNNFRNGITFFDNANGTIENNTITGNLNYGILEDCRSEYAENNVLINENNFSENGQGNSYLCN